MTAPAMKDLDGKKPEWSRPISAVPPPPPPPVPFGESPPSAGRQQQKASPCQALSGEPFIMANPRCHVINRFILRLRFSPWRLLCAVTFPANLRKRAARRRDQKPRAIRLPCPARRRRQVPSSGTLITGAFRGFTK